MQPGLKQPQLFRVAEGNDFHAAVCQVLDPAAILKYYLDLENQDLIRGLARYNGSKGRRKYGDRVIDKLNRKWYRN